jgi:serine/threonine protein kinase
MVERPIFEPGQRCGAYVIVQLKSRGVPELYLAKHATSEALVHLHCADIRATGEATPSEAQWSAGLEKLAALRHPCVPKLLASGVHEDAIRWIASEHAPGRPFPVFAGGSGPAPLGEVMAYALIVAETLRSAQEAGLLHGNLSLRSVLMRSRAEGVDASLRVLGIGSVELFGLPLHVAEKTPLFRAPEQLRGEAIEARSDIYSLGMILYTLIVRRPPFGSADASSSPDLLTLSKSEVPPPLPDIAGCSEFVSNAIEVAIQKQPAKRWPDWTHFGLALNHAFRSVRGDAATRKADEELKAARERAQSTEAHYIESHPENEGLESGFRVCGVDATAEPEGEAETRSGAMQEGKSALIEVSPPSTQRSGAARRETPPPPPPLEQTSDTPAPILPKAPESREPRIRRVGISTLLGVTSVAVGVILGVTLPGSFFNARVEIAIPHAPTPGSLSLAGMEAPPNPQDAPPSAGTPPSEPWEPRPLPQSSSSLPHPHPVPSQASPKSVVSSLMKNWDQTRRVRVRPAPSIAAKE